MAFARSYSEAYDSFNFDKNYQSEANFVLELYKLHRTSPLESILDLGSGSGLHLEYLIPLLNQVKKIVAVDSSEILCEKAKKRLGKKATVLQARISDVSINYKFDLVISLYHVINYQTKKDDLLEYFSSIKKHLKDDGLVVIDFWNLAAWRNNPPSTRTKEVSISGFNLKRTTIPDTDHINGITTLKMNIFKEDAVNGEILESFQETHVLRAFTIFEIMLACTLTGLKVEKYGTWMNAESELEADDWYGYAILTHAGVE